MDVVETAFRGAMAYPHQTKAEVIERQARGIVAWNGTRVARLSLMPGGHALMLEHPDAFTRALLRFLKGVRSPRGR